MEAGQNGAATDHVVKRVTLEVKQGLEPVTTQYRRMVDKIVMDPTWKIDIATLNPAFRVSNQYNQYPS